MTKCILKNVLSTLVPVCVSAVGHGWRKKWNEVKTAVDRFHFVTKENTIDTNSELSLINTMQIKTGNMTQSHKHN